MSILFDGFGLDWFILSRRDQLYILVGVLKCLILLASYVWRQLFIVSQTKSSKNFAHHLSTGLFFISITWWIFDWMRIIFNTFPDGHGVPLLS